MNTLFITVVLLYKTFSFLFQDFETVTFYVLFVYKPTFSVIFCWIERVRVSRKFNSLFILYISFDLAKLEMSKIYQRNFQSLCRLAQLFLNILAVILQKKSEIVGGNFFPALKMQFGRFYWNIKKKMCKYKHSLTKIETSYIVDFLNGTNCRLVDYKYWKSGYYTFILSNYGQFFVVTQTVHDFPYRK